MRPLVGCSERCHHSEYRSVEKLFGASHAEMHGRNLIPEQAPPASPKAQDDHRASTVAKASKTSCPLPVTQGKLNAIRAALKAGVKPNTIARQFGVTSAMIKKAMEDS